MKIVNSICNGICYITGHRWVYKDYNNWIKENGEPYDFNASRKCSCCTHLEYHFGEWVPVKVKFSQYDVMPDIFYQKKCPSLHVVNQPEINQSYQLIKNKQFLKDASTAAA